MVNEKINIQSIELINQYFYLKDNLLILEIIFINALKSSGHSI